MKGKATMKWYQQIVEGFGERMRNIAAFAPIFELNQKQKYDYPMASLGVAVMLFILENMLRGGRDCTYEKISNFLQDIIRHQYGDELSYEEALDLAYTLVREGLMNQGKPHVLHFPDWEVRQEESHKFHLIELDDYEIKDKVVRLKLSTVGLELLFKTKEMYNELQVSITQLYLRQQIQKGVFDGALRSVEELDLAVRNEREKIRKLEEKIIQDVMQVAREKEVEKQMDRINEQLMREKKVFSELEELIDHTMQEYRSGELTEKEAAAVEKIMQIQTRLHGIISLHESLFTDKLRIQKLMNRSIESLIMSAFNTRVNFESEFLRPVVRHGVHIEALKQILDPLFPIQRQTSFHPGRVFLEQPLKRDSDAFTEEELWELEEDALRREEERERILQEEKERRYESYFLLLLQPLIEKEEVLISEILKALSEQDEKQYHELIQGIEFYPFFVQLHQMGIIPLLTRWEMDAVVVDDLPRVLIKVVEEHADIRRLSGFELLATGEVIHLPNGYVLTDFIVRRREPGGMA